MARQVAEVGQRVLALGDVLVDGHPAALGKVLLEGAEIATVLDPLDVGGVRLLRVCDQFQPVLDILLRVVAGIGAFRHPEPEDRLERGAGRCLFRRHGVHVKEGRVADRQPVARIEDGDALAHVADRGFEPDIGHLAAPQLVRQPLLAVADLFLALERPLELDDQAGDQRRYAKGERGADEHDGHGALPPGLRDLCLAEGDVDHEWIGRDGLDGDEAGLGVRAGSAAERAAPRGDEGVPLRRLDDPDPELIRRGGVGDVDRAVLAEEPRSYSPAGRRYLPRC